MFTVCGFDRKAEEGASLGVLGTDDNAASDVAGRREPAGGYGMAPRLK